MMGWMVEKTSNCWLANVIQQVAAYHDVGIRQIPPKVLQYAGIAGIGDEAAA